MRGSFPMVSPEASHPLPFARPAQAPAIGPHRGYLEHRQSYPILSRERPPLPSPTQFSAHFPAQRAPPPAADAIAKRPFFDNA